MGESRPERDVDERCTWWSERWGRVRERSTKKEGARNRERGVERTRMRDGEGGGAVRVGWGGRAQVEKAQGIEREREREWVRGEREKRRGGKARSEQRRQMMGIEVIGVLSGRGAHRACGAVLSHPPRMRKAMGSNPSVSRERAPGRGPEETRGPREDVGREGTMRGSVTMRRRGGTRNEEGGGG